MTTANGRPAAVVPAITDTPDWVLPRADGYRLYFGVPDGNIANLPTDAIFDVIDTSEWRKERWVAIDRIEKYGKNKGEWGRVYCIRAERSLDADECGVWQEWIEQWEAGYVTENS